MCGKLHYKMFSRNRNREIIFQNDIHSFVKHLDFTEFICAVAMSGEGQRVREDGRITRKFSS